MSLPDNIAAGADDGPTGLPPRPGKAGRVLLFFVYFFGFAIGIPLLAVAVVQARYGLIDGPPSSPADGFGEQVKAITRYGIFVWAGLQFFILGRIASWTSQVPAVPGVGKVSAETLTRRLLDLNEQALPYTVSRGSRDNELVVDWRYAEAKWPDLMRIRGVRRGYRLVLRLDEGAHNVRAQDRYASFDWPTVRGRDLAALNWSVSLGTTFYEYGTERAFGLRFKDGKPVFDLGDAYTFDLNELKQPMIEIIRNSGWNFRPVITFFRLIGG